MRHQYRFELALVLCGDRETCRVQLLKIDRRLEAPYAPPMRERGIWAAPGQLVAVDLGDTPADPPQIVYRWAQIRAVQTQGAFVLTQDDQAVTPAQLRADEFPKIKAMYARIQTAKEIDPKQLVQNGYDQIAERYLEWAQADASGLREKYVSLLLEELPPGVPVLELGCGAGVPGTQRLARRFHVTGVDLSARQIALARQNVPQAHFLQADMSALDLPPESYHAVIALYSLFHVPRDEQPRLLRKIAAWLRPGGLLVATMSTGASAGDVDDDFLGAPMYWSTYDSETNLRLVQEAGLELVRHKVEAVEEFGQLVRFLWVVARKPQAAL